MVTPTLVGCFDAGSEDDCLGPTCPWGFDKPNGGEVRLEYIRLPNNVQMSRATAFFIKEQTPDNLPVPIAGTCVDFRDTDYFPLNQAENREYIDVGSSVTIRGPEGVTYNLARQEPGTNDFIQRTHDIFYSTLQLNPIDTDPLPDAFFNATYDVELEVETEFSELLSGHIFMPQRFEWIQPKDEGTVQFTANEDFPLAWQLKDHSADGFTNKEAALLAFALPQENAPPLPIAACFQRNVGEFTIPGDFLATLPENGLFLVGSLVDDPVLTSDGRLIHLVSQHCMARPYNIAQ